MNPLTRRSFLQAAAALGVAAPGAPAAPALELGCQTLPYRALPLDRALEGIRKAGYKYVMPYYTHAGKNVFTPDLPAAQLAELKRKFSDAGLTPFCRFAGLEDEEGKTDLFRKELDLCAEFGIRTVVAIGPWAYDNFPNLPKRDREWRKIVAAFYARLEKMVAHAEATGVTLTFKPHTGITATAKACMEFLRRVPSDRVKISWDAGNVSFYEGICPDPDLPDLAPNVKSVCIKDHKGLRGEANFPTPGEGQVDHDLMFRVLAGAGFRGPVAVERVDGNGDAAKMPAELIDQRIAGARNFLVPILEKYSRG
ncbi:MAG: sugar phosphate isomerase/epimerase family protein [Acidobacteriota bacterium]